MAKEEYTQLCVWPGTDLGTSTPAEFEKWFLDQGFRIKFAESVTTLPDLDEGGKPVPDTGGRIDLFFYIHTDDIAEFAIPRLHVGIRWWEDVIVYNDNSHLYEKSVLEKYPPTW